MLNNTLKLSKFVLLGILLLVSPMVFGGCGGGGGGKGNATPTLTPVAIEAFNLTLQQSDSSNYGDTFDLVRRGTLTASKSGNALVLSAVHIRQGDPKIEQNHYKFELNITPTSGIEQGDLFRVGGATNSVTGFTKRPTLGTQTWSTQSGQVKVLSRSRSRLNLQVSDLVFTPNPGVAKGTLTFNGAIEVQLQD